MGRRTVLRPTRRPIKTLTERVRHVVQSCFNGRRIVIFSGGPTAGDDEVFSEARVMRDGGSFGAKQL
jgi:class I fructose-bisphosphate aldolase